MHGCSSRSTFGALACMLPTSLNLHPHCSSSFPLLLFLLHCIGGLFLCNLLFYCVQVLSQCFSIPTSFCDAGGHPYAWRLHHCPFSWHIKGDRSPSLQSPSTLYCLPLGPSYPPTCSTLPPLCMRSIPVQLPFPHAPLVHGVSLAPPPSHQNATNTAFPPRRISLTAPPTHDVCPLSPLLMLMPPPWLCSSLYA